MILHYYTLFHVVLRLIAIFTGFVVLLGILRSELLAGWTKWFLVTAVATTVTG